MAIGKSNKSIIFFKFLIFAIEFDFLNLILAPIAVEISNFFARIGTESGRDFEKNGNVALLNR